MSKSKLKHPPIDLMQDDHTNESFDPTLLGHQERIGDEVDRDDIGEDRDRSSGRDRSKPSRPHPSD